MSPGGAEIAGDQRQIAARQIADAMLVECLPQQFEVRRCQITRTIAGRRRKPSGTNRARSVSLLGRCFFNEAESPVRSGHRWIFARQHRFMKRADHGNDLVRLVPRRDCLFDAAAHICFAHQVLRSPARLILLLLTQSSGPIRWLLL